MYQYIRIYIYIYFIILLFISTVFCDDNKTTSFVSYGLNNISIEFYQPKSFSKDPINYYSLIHFVEYAVLAIIPFVKIKHFWSISIGWEVLELFISKEWARESWLNKLFDLLFNWLGFNSVRAYSGRKSK